MRPLLNVLKDACFQGSRGVVVEGDDLRRIQNVLLSMLRDIIGVCEAEGIEYMLGGGSALGAVRHGGFIPWDDDIDINMRRSELLRFLPLFEKKYGDKYWILVPGRTPGYDYLMVHIMLRSVRARALMEPAGAPCGLCIDIFPIENVPDNALLRKVHGAMCMGFRYILSCLRFKSCEAEIRQLSADSDELRRYAQKRLRVARVAALLPVSVWLRLADRCMALCKNEHSRYVTIPSGQKQYFGELCGREEVTQRTHASFEGCDVRIPGDYDAYLTRLYGDYMQAPPPEKREMHVMMELDREALAHACGQNGGEH